MYVGFVCDNCKYEHEELKDGWKITCDKYPEKIPIEVSKKNSVDACEYFVRKSEGK